MPGAGFGRLSYGLRTQRWVRRHPEVCRGPGIDGLYHCGDGGYQADALLRLLAEWVLLEIFGVEVLEERAT